MRGAAISRKKRGMRAVRNALISLVLLAAAGIGPNAPDAPVAPAAWGQTAARGAPRLAFQIGDHLVYERQVIVSALDREPPAAAATGSANDDGLVASDGGPGATHGESGAGGAPLAAYAQQLQYWCLDVQDGRAMLLGELTDVVDGRGRCAGGMIFYVDDRGRCSIPAEFVTRLDELAPLLEPWPEFYEAFRTGNAWTTSADALGRRLACVERGPDEQDAAQVRVEFIVQEAPEIAVLLGHSASGSYRFDPRERAVTAMRVTREDLRTERRTDVALRLYLKDRVPEMWSRRRREEIERFAQVVRMQQRYRDRLGVTPADADAILRDMSRFWSELTRWLTARGDDSPVRRLLAYERRRLEARLAVLQAEARLAQRWLREAPVWTAPESAQPAAPESIAAPEPAALEPIAPRAVAPGPDAPIESDERGGLTMEMLWSVADEASVRMLPKVCSVADGPHASVVVCVNVDGDADAVAASGGLCGDAVRQTATRRRPAELGDLPLPVYVVRRADGTVARVAFGLREDVGKLLETE